MQFTNNHLLLASIAAGSASAMAVPRQASSSSTTPQFNITNFAFSGTPHSVVSYYTLNATYGDAAADTPEVECSTTTNTSPSVSSFELTACQDPTWSFSFTPQNTSSGSGYSLEVTHFVNDNQKNDTGCVWIPSSDVQERVDPNAPTGNVYYVNYGPSFNLDYGQMDMCIYA